ncbi:MAG: radical SAM protein [Chloroflexi bacterium]|nr:radical SAM protein [Chloroflexota bacterium]
MIAIDPECLRLRRAHFPDQITFHAPGLKRYRTSEYANHVATEFIPISVTGAACALNCDHCQTTLLQGMRDLSRFDGSLFDLCATLAQRGARGILVSGGSDRRGCVPLRDFIPDLARVRRELGLAIRVHPGLPDEETCAALAPLGVDGAMIDVIGHADTIREIYHLDATPEDYDAALARLEQHRIPTIPHIILGLHYGRMLGEWHALEMIARHSPKVLVLVILMPLSGTPMAQTPPPPLSDIAGFFETARKTLPRIPIVLGCARPLGEMKIAIDRLAIDAGLNGIAYPADGSVAYARARNLEPSFINACCGVTW